MKKTFLALAMLSTISACNAGTYPYQAGWNPNGFTETQTGTMSGEDYAIFAVVSPPEGKYLLQVSNGSDSPAIQHKAILVDGQGKTLQIQNGLYPSFYVQAGVDLPGDEVYLLYVYNVNLHGNPSCKKGPCNVTLLIQPTK